MNAKLKVPTPSLQSATPAKLKVTKGPYKGVVYKLVAGKITIGRSSENDISLANDDKVSRKQALLQMEKEGHYVIKDLSNRASLKLNNIVTLKSDLQDGDLIQCGSTVLQFELTPLTPALGVVPPPAHSGQASLPPVPSNPSLSLTPPTGPEPTLSLMEKAEPYQQPLSAPFPHPTGDYSQQSNKKAGKQKKKPQAENNHAGLSSCIPLSFSF